MIKFEKDVLFIDENNNEIKFEDNNRFKVSMFLQDNRTFLIFDDEMFEVNLVEETDNYFKFKEVIRNE
jgi:hypothetical protein